MVYAYALRYGDDIEKRRERRKADVMELLQIDQIKRIFALLSEVCYIRNYVTGQDVQAMDNTLQQQFCHVYLHIDRAEDLPNMDILHGVDSYCVISIQNITDEVYRTRVVHKTTSPVFGEDFEWNVPMEAKLMTIAIVNHDTVTDDNLVCDLSYVPAVTL